MDGKSAEEKKFNWRIVVFFGIVILIYLLIEVDFSSMVFATAILPALFILFIMLHFLGSRLWSSSAQLDQRTKRIFLSAIGLLLTVMGVGKIENPGNISWFSKLLPGNMALWKYIYVTFFSGIIYVLLGFVIAIVPWLTMWNGRKKVIALAYPLLFIVLGVNRIFIDRHNSVGIGDVYGLLPGLLSIFIGVLFLFIFSNPKAIENLP